MAVDIETGLFDSDCSDGTCNNCKKCRPEIAKSFLLGIRIRMFICNTKAQYYKAVSWFLNIPNKLRHNRATAAVSMFLKAVRGNL